MSVVPTPVPDGAAPPARCPACRSRDLKTTSKVVNADAYWRCCDCGEVWNVGRHHAGSRYDTRDLPFRH
jgi:transposase-like protein